MKIEKIKFSKEFHYQNGNQWVGAEAFLDPGENEDEAFEKLAKKINQWGNSFSNLDLGFGPDVTAPPATQPPVINRQDQRLMDLLEDCTTLEELNKYLPDVKIACNPQVNQVWDKMGTKLFNK